jgi:hypothetical protein
MFLFANASPFWIYARDLLDILHKLYQGEAFAHKTLDFPTKSGRKCFTPTPKYRLSQEIYSRIRSSDDGG